MEFLASVAQYDYRVQAPRSQSLEEEYAILQALPPAVQMRKEIEAILNDPECADRLQNAEIREIRKVDGGYVIVTDSAEMRVDIRYLPQEKHFCGPAKFEWSFHDPETYSTLSGLELMQQATLPYFELETEVDPLLQHAIVQALPPYFQTKKEIEAILNDPECAHLLGNAAIQEVRKVDGGYVIITDFVELRVDVHYVSKRSCGPAQFEWSFNEPVNR